MAHKGKRIATALESVDKNKLYALDEAVKIVKANATAKFDETIELAINLGVDPRHADQMVRGVVELRGQGQFSHNIFEPCEVWQEIARFIQFYTEKLIRNHNRILGF